MKKHLLCSFGLVAVLLSTSSAVGISNRLHYSDPPTVVVTADFAKLANYPLSKSRFAAYNSGWVALTHYDRDIPLFDEIKPNSLRIDLWWGAGVWSPQPVSGSSTSVTYYFAQMDHIAGLLNAHQIKPYWAYCYIPQPLQSVPGDSRYVTQDTKLWGEILATFARHAKEGGPSKKIAFHEIYNEPDNADFFRSGRDSYFALYRDGSKAIRAADPDAVIGGPALAFTPSWVDPFLSMVTTEKLPLDFFSFHFYPKCWGTNSVADVVGQMRALLSKHPGLATTEMHLNEFNSFPIDYPRLGSQDRYSLAAALLQDYEWFLSQRDVTQVNWAQFQDTGGGNWSGMISIEGKRKAVFNAAAIYARMPIDRAQVSISEPGTLGSMASASEHRASLVLWNKSTTNLTIRALLPNVPFTNCNLSIYRIDPENSSWGDNPTNELLKPVEARTAMATHGLQWVGLLPGKSVAYIEASDSQLWREPAAFPSKVLRILNYYPDRQSRCYTDFDEREWTARLGMGPESSGIAQVGLVAENLPRSIRVRALVDGSPRKIDVNSTLGIRLDYCAGTNYTRSVLYYGPTSGSPSLYDAQRSSPMTWGTRRQADELFPVPDFSDFIVNLNRWAPPDWTGRVQISFIMQNTGAGSRAKIHLCSD